MNNILLQKSKEEALERLGAIATITDIALLAKELIRMDEIEAGNFVFDLYTANREKIISLLAYTRSNNLSDTERAILFRYLGKLRFSLRFFDFIT